MVLFFFENYTGVEVRRPSLCCTDLCLYMCLIKELKGVAVGGAAGFGFAR